MNSELKTSSLNTEVNVQTTQPLIALYCGSRSGNKPIYQEKAIALAQGLAKQGFGRFMAVPVLVSWDKWPMP